MRHVRIHITGIVQGVGFRPFAYREAVARGLSGWVLNAGDGVHIDASGEEAAVASFVRALREKAPAAAQVDRVEVADAPSGGGTGNTFRIIASEDDTDRTTLVSPDIATCPDCLKELFDPANRRYHYPFINCTNCGPRYTIIRELPYDRAQTSMGGFPMCADCASEYTDPLDRRFHAQPDACFACGPHLTWRERAQETAQVGDDLTASDAIVSRCAELLATGGIVAIKGLGGFHLACDAGNDAAVQELRRRKRRSNKPLAIMVRAVEDAQALCTVDETERSLLSGTVRPIVLLRRRTRAEAEIAPSVTWDLPEIGVMLPYTPLQHLLLAACAERGVRALVMTSGNLSEEPIEVDDERAWERLVAGGLSDALLGNDRPILARFDDSVVRVVDGETQIVRRARGYAPRPLALPAMRPHAGDLPNRGGAPSILACGPEQKATLALTRELPDGAAECLLSQHIGDLENAETLDAWNACRTHLEHLFDIAPAALACDTHPSYLSSQWARAEAERRNLPLVEVQHHHAHLASVLAEAAARGELRAEEPVVGIALDGTGAGPDGTVWGGEVLIVSLTGFERVGHLRQWRLPGGAAAVRDARRCAYALLLAHGLDDHPGARPLLARLTQQELSLTRTMVARGFNSPLTSSMGRFLDAAAALLGICDRASYEGEPAIELEAAATRWRERSENGAAPVASKRPDRPPIGGTGSRDPSAIDLSPVLEDLLAGISRGSDRDELAYRAHIETARIVAEAAIRAARERDITSVALSGGVFMNRIMLQGVTSLLIDRGLRVFVPRSVPLNDGCIAYGQAAVARARLAAERTR